jgi:hypothetical protein
VLVDGVGVVADAEEVDVGVEESSVVEAVVAPSVFLAFPFPPSKPSQLFNLLPLPPTVRHFTTSCSPTAPSGLLPPGKLA